MFTTLTAAVADVEDRHPQLAAALLVDAALPALLGRQPEVARDVADRACLLAAEGTPVHEPAQLAAAAARIAGRAEEQTSELQSLMRISYADVCLNKKQNN